MSLKLSKEVISEPDRLARLESRNRSALARKIAEERVRAKRTQRSAELYQAQRISLWKAARLSGLSLWEMIAALFSRKMQIQYSEHDLNENLTL